MQPDTDSVGFGAIAECDPIQDLQSSIAPMLLDADLRDDTLRRLDDTKAKIARRALQSATQLDADSHPKVVEGLFRALHEVLCSLEQYEDLAAILRSSAIIDSAVDENCVTVYRLLLTGILGGEFARRRARELAEAFQDHRDRVGVGE